MSLIYQTIWLILISDTFVVSQMPNNHKLQRFDRLICDDAKFEKGCEIDEARIFKYKENKLTSDCWNSNHNLNKSKAAVARKDCKDYVYKGHSMFDFQLVEQSGSHIRYPHLLYPTNFYYFQEGLLRQKIQLNRDCTHIGESCAKIEHYFHNSARNISRTYSITTHPAEAITTTCEFHYDSHNLLSSLKCPLRGTVVGTQLYEISYGPRAATLREYYLFADKEKQLVQTITLGVQEKESVVTVFRSQRRKTELTPYVEKYYY